MKRNIIFFAISILLCSCSQQILVLPPYTSVSKIIELKTGMSIQQVNETLGIEPYDIYTKQDDGTTILIYNYRQKARETKYMTFNLLHTEELQKEGEVYYTNPSQVYVLFQNDKLKSLITDSGRRDAEYILLTNNNIQFISKENLVSLLKTEQNDSIVILTDKNKLETISLPKNDNKTQSVIIPLNPNIENQDNEIVPIQVKSKATTKALGVFGGAGLFIIFLTLLL